MPVKLRCTCCRKRKPLDQYSGSERYKSNGAHWACDECENLWRLQQEEDQLRIRQIADTAKLIQHDGWTFESANQHGDKYLLKWKRDGQTVHRWVLSSWAQECIDAGQILSLIVGTMKAAISKQPSRMPLLKHFISRSLVCWPPPVTTFFRGHVVEVNLRRDGLPPNPKYFITVAVDEWEATATLEVDSHFGRDAMAWHHRDSLWISFRVDNGRAVDIIPEVRG